MKLYHSIGPNPRLVKMFAAEKGIALELRDVDIIAGDNRLPAYLAINPTGTTPVLELDDGSHVAETAAICEFLEELQPRPALIGDTPARRAAARMWWRRVDLLVVQPMTAGFRGAEGLPLFKDRVVCLPQAADDLKRSARQGLDWFEEQVGDRPYIAGDAMTVADLLLFCFVEFGAQVGQGLAPAHRRLAHWRDRVAGRPSAGLPWL
ncbi:glutathione S-transferase family protein [Thauera linaloolentis]|uniref:Glutathione S-transferase n=1 Tax=Thauera linaloolentis (strain DSM 12138 / JCM 21573 / CCUG 41526 / CIP 105981 / IAM 15112 / NBRC 102519 / 47Lol) TaxID=1123367 RepID=N6YYS1_THAL4|nr:glutathione S-transferase family protein [Thauera linaloolentis]ENO87288.1 glutathione S-transferase [Thauera linaloolentis 47Lol = DSM 12138]MCM8566737.1 glutathione S-transferase family protein [Thauera linaloolentis]